MSKLQLSSQPSAQQDPKHEVKAVQTSPKRIIVNVQPEALVVPAEPVIRTLGDRQSAQTEALAIGRQLADAERRKAAQLRREAQAAKKQARQARHEAMALRRQARIERLRSRELIQPAVAGWLAGLGSQAQGVRHELRKDLDKVGQRLEHNLAQLGHGLDDISHSLEGGIRQLRPKRKFRLFTQPEQSKLLPRLGIGLGVIAGGLAVFGAFKLVSKTLARRKAHQDLGGGLKGSASLADSIEMGKLTGDWFELARLPHGQEKGAVGCELHISRVDERELAIRYTCELDGFNGPRHEARYKVKLLNDGKIRLHSFPLLYTYSLIEQTEDYLVVGGENRKHLWILSRSRSLPDATLDALLGRLSAQGFDPAKLVMVAHQDPALSPYEVPKRAQSF